MSLGGRVLAVFIHTHAGLNSSELYPVLETSLSHPPVVTLPYPRKCTIHWEISCMQIMKYFYQKCPWGLRVWILFYGFHRLNHILHRSIISRPTLENLSNYGTVRDCWVSVKVWSPHPGFSVKNGYPPPQGAGSFSGQQGRIAQKGHPGQRGNCAKGIFCFVLFLFLCV